MDELSLFPNPGDLSDKQDSTNIRKESKTRLNSKGPVVKPRKPHKISITPGPPH